jgi:uncharacterized repeat protein (TIGR01451 family)
MVLRLAIAAALSFSVGSFALPSGAGVMPTRSQAGQADMAVTVFKGPANGLGQAIAHPVVGQRLLWGISITNNGPDTVDTETIAIQLPSTVSFQSAAVVSCTVVGTTLTCTGHRTLAPGAELLFDLALRADGVGTFTLTPTVTSALADPDSSNNSKSITTTVTAGVSLGVLQPNPRKPHAGHRFTVSAAVGPTGAGPATVGCAARAGTHRLKPLVHRFARGRAICTWVIPARDRGRRLVGRVSATRGPIVAARRFSQPIL